MAVPVRLDLPYERQAMKNHMCGAAALCMVYRSLDVACSQEEVWPTIRACDSSGTPRTRTYLICADALRRGLSAMTLQVRQSLGLLRAALERGVRVIVHHRPGLNCGWGHYGVLVGMDDEGLTIHDPWSGPAKWFDQAEWLKLWRPGPGNTEVRGNLAVFIGPHKAETESCRVCERVVPPNVPCPTCRKQIPLQPNLVLGCVEFDCPERTWDLLFCPWCDAQLDRLE